MVNLKSFFSGRRKKSNATKKSKDNLDVKFYCALCFKYMNYSDLIDGCKCCFCSNDLFVYPHKE